MQKTHSLGLINRTYPSDGEFDPNNTKTQWERFANYVTHLNKESSSNTQYKLVFLARHAEGWHNVAEKIFAQCWDVCMMLQTEEFADKLSVTGLNKMAMEQSPGKTQRSLPKV
jgi:hypothetical protein